MSILQRLVVIKELLCVEVLVVLLLELVFVLLPEGHHAVEGLNFDVVLIFKGLVSCLVLL